MTTLRDKFANLASIKATVTAGSTVFTELLTGISLGQGMGIVIDEIDYYTSDILGDFDAADEYIYAALCTSNTMDDVAIEQKTVIHQFKAQRVDYGTAASGVWITEPNVFQFDPPLIVAAPRLYVGTAAPAGITGFIKMRLFYRYIKLTSQEYLEIAESMLLVG